MAYDEVKLAPPLHNNISILLVLRSDYSFKNNLNLIFIVISSNKLNWLFWLLGLNTGIHNNEITT